MKLDRPIPKSLYKYRSVDRAEEIIRDKKVYFANVKELNDPEDCRFDISLERGFGHRLLGRNPGYTRQQILRKRKQAEEKLRRTVHGLLHRHLGVFSLSAKNDDPQLWCHYGYMGTGICLEFRFQLGDPAHEFFLTHGRRGPRLFSYVTYSKRKPVVVLSETLAMDDTDKCIKIAVLTKTSRWTYEQEWRLLDAHDGAGTKPFPPGLLAGLILGPETPTEDRVRILQAAKEYPCPLKTQEAVRNPQGGLTIVPFRAMS